MQDPLSRLIAYVEASDTHYLATNEEASTSDWNAEDEKFEGDPDVDIFDVIIELSRKDDLISEAMGYCDPAVEARREMPVAKNFTLRFWTIWIDRRRRFG